MKMGSKWFNYQHVSAHTHILISCVHMFFIFSLVKHILTVRAVQRLKIQINKTIVHFFSRASILIFKGFSIEYYTIFGTLRHSQVAKKTIYEFSHEKR